MNLSETTIHFWKLGLDKQEMLRRVDDGAEACKSGERPGWATETCKHGCLPSEEMVLMEDANTRLRDELSPDDGKHRLEVHTA